MITLPASDAIWPNCKARPFLEFSSSKAESWEFIRRPLFGGPGMTRTCDLRFRKPLLYPAELRDRVNRDVAYGLRSCIRPAGSGKYLPMRAARIIGLIALFAAASAHPAHAEDEAPAACRLETLGVFIPGLAIDGRTFRLKDGRAVRLAGIE